MPSLSSARKKKVSIEVGEVAPTATPRITRSKKEFLADDIDNIVSPVGRPLSNSYDSDAMLDIGMTTDENEDDMEDVAARHASINGFTESGEKFEVPPTRNTLTMLMRWNEIPTLVTWVAFIMAFYVALPQRFMDIPILDYFEVQGYPRHYLLYVSVFWRLMYNVTLAFVLDYQSRTKGLTRMVTNVSKNKGSWTYNIMAMLLRGNLGGNPIEEKPAEFNAWILNTQFVNVILPNDVFAFILFAIMEINVPGYGDLASYNSGGGNTANLSLFSFIPLTQMDNRVYVAFHGVVYLVGVTLIIGSTISKMLSHDIIGYYAWFWGDFFFKIDKTLKFDGIFEVFPHPMYTVGYAWMYGVSMISNSFQVFALTMFCHLMQMVFLAAMEEPHIQRTYGVEFEKNKSTHRENIFIIHNFDPFRASDWMMVIICILFVLTTIVCGGVLGMEPLVSESYFIGTALFTTLVCKSGIAFMLYKQGKTRFWTGHFTKSGSTREKAFDEWKRIQNLADNLSNIAFLVLAWRMFQWPELEAVLFHRWTYLCEMLFITILFGISYWSSTECYNALGDYGWFYGDFFILSPKDEQYDNGEGYVARGIYRYFAHPDILFGKFWLYACAFMCRSIDVAAIAMIHHALCLVQLITIEEPHMKRIYQKRIKNFGGVIDTLTKLKVLRGQKKLR